MSIAKRIKEAVNYLNNDDLEASLLPLCTAIDATAKKTYPNLKENKKKMTKWLRYKQGFVTWFLLRGAELTGNIKIQSMGKSLEDCVYLWIRCDITHEAKLDKKISLTNIPVLGTTNDGLLFSKRHCEGLVLAVVSSPINSSEKFSDQVNCYFLPEDVQLNDLWGKELEVRQKLNIIENRWS